MRTRRSWRNQDRLFAALFKPAETPRPVIAPDTAESLEARLADPFLSRRGRMDLERRLALELQRAKVRAVLASE